MNVAVLMAVLTAGTTAKGLTLCREAAPGLTARAKIMCSDARKKAVSRVPGAQVKSAELEEENGKLVYSFDLRRKGMHGVKEVQVDAVSGAVVSVRHESAAREASEQRGETAAPR